MCSLVIQAIKDGNEQVIKDVKRIAGPYEKLGWLPTTAQELCGNIFHTIYMGKFSVLLAMGKYLYKLMQYKPGMSTQSSKETRTRAKELSEAIGAYHTEVEIDDMFEGCKSILAGATGFEPKFKMYGGTPAENLALQNIR